MAILHSLHYINAPIGDKACAVLRGPTWYAMELGAEPLSLCQCHSYLYSPEPDEHLYTHSIIGHARFFSRMLVNFSTLETEMPKCLDNYGVATYADLLQVMRKEHGENFKEQELVTLLYYFRID